MFCRICGQLFLMRWGYPIVGNVDEDGDGDEMRLIKKIPNGRYAVHVPHCPFLSLTFSLNFIFTETHEKPTPCSVQKGVFSFGTLS